MDLDWRLRMYGEPTGMSRTTTDRGGVGNTFRIDTSVTGDFVVATMPQALAGPRALAEPEDRVDPEAEQAARAACSTGGCGCSRVGPGPTKGAWIALTLGTAGGFGLLIGLFFLFGR